MNKTDKNPCLHRVIFPWKETDQREEKKSPMCAMAGEQKDRRKEWECTGESVVF